MKQEQLAEDCGHCRYYLEFNEDDLNDDDEEDAMTGNCRRYPPVVFPGFPVSTSVYPEVSATKGWCGEFMPAS